MILSPHRQGNHGSIIALGTAVPAQAVTQDQALEVSGDIICENDRQKRMLRMLYRKSGVSSRRTVIPWSASEFWTKKEHRGPGTGMRIEMYERYAPLLASASSRAALGLPSPTHDVTTKQSPKDPLMVPGGVESVSAGVAVKPARIDPKTVTHLVTVSCTGFAAPGFDWALFETLGLRDDVQRVQVGFMGCHGMINGLRVARGLAAAEPDAVILVCAVELCSLHYRMNWENEAMIGNALFADGSAAAVVVGPNHPAAHQMTDAGTALSLAASGSVRIPESEDQMTWRIGDFGFDMNLSGQVPISIRAHLAEWMSEWLRGQDLSISDIGGWMVHPGGPRILDATEEALALEPSALAVSRSILNNYGNMSSPTVLFVLQQTLRQKRTGPWVLLAFGPGLVAEAMLLR
ncbi:MAG: type III polyketide synthase [Planctomycetota bacterium]